MKNTHFIVASISVFTVVTATIGQVIIYQLDQATAKQCREHAWPAAADQIHRDWCIGNGYKI
jgi:hypothetical protein